MIYVWMCSRSGSSMVAGLLYHHGLKLSGEDNRTPYRAFENKQAHKMIRKGIDPQLKDDFWKGGIGQFNNWLKHIDPLEHLHLYVRRDPEQVTDSLIKYGGRDRRFHRGDILKQVKIAYGWMDTVKYFCGGVNVYTEKLWKRDFSNIRDAFAYCDLEFNEQIANRFIEFRQ